MTTRSGGERYDDEEHETASRQWTTTESERTMTVQTNTKERVGTIRKTKALAAGLLVAAMMAAGTLVAAPAHAATTFTVNSTADAPDAFTTSNTCDTDVFTSSDQCTLRAAIQQRATRLSIPTCRGTVVRLPVAFELPRFAKACGSPGLLPAGRGRSLANGWYTCERRWSVPGDEFGRIERDGGGDATTFSEE